MLAIKLQRTASLWEDFVLSKKTKLNKQLYCRDRFLRVYIFSKSQWPWATHRLEKLFGDRLAHCWFCSSGFVDNKNAIEHRLPSFHFPTQTRHSAALLLRLRACLPFGLRDTIMTLSSCADVILCSSWTEDDVIWRVGLSYRTLTWLLGICPLKLKR